MFNKFEMGFAISIAAFLGYAAGYTRAREKFIEVLLKASAEKKEQQTEENN